jgi:hypothetical protein
MAESDKAFIAVNPCGCVTAAMVVGYVTKREEKAELKRWMKSGRRVELTTVGEARQGQNFLSCPHEDRVKPDEITDEAERLVSEARS